MISDSYSYRSKFNQMENALINPKNSIKKICPNDHGQSATILLKAFLSDYLGLSPEEAKGFLTVENIEKLNLGYITSKFKRFFPPELKGEEKNNPWFIITILYPDYFPYDKQKYVLKRYEEIVNSETAKSPRKLFEIGPEGRERSIICMNYAILREFPSHTAQELYDYFAEPEKADSFIARMRLKDAVLNNFNDPVELLHESLSENEKNAVFMKKAQLFYNMRKMLKFDNRKNEYFIKLITPDQEHEFCEEIIKKINYHMKQIGWTGLEENE